MFFNKLWRGKSFNIPSRFKIGILMVIELDGETYAKSGQHTELNDLCDSIK